MSTKNKEIKRVVNKEFSEKDEHFKKCCENAEVKATARQASKFRMGKGLAYKNRKRGN
jgi:hypothetical protein